LPQQREYDGGIQIKRVPIAKTRTRAARRPIPNASRTWLSSPSLVLGPQASAFCCKPIPAGLIPKPFSDQDVLREQENLTHPPVGASLANLELLGR
jgi:hypothetical protein